MEKRNEENLRPTKDAGKLQQISEGWGNKVKKAFNLLDSEIEEIGRKRKEICDVCPFNSKNTLKDSTEFKLKIIEGHAKNNIIAKPVDYTSMIPVDHCVWCGCDISAKTLAMSSNCGMLDYNKRFNGNEPLKWEAVNIEE